MLWVIDLFGICGPKIVLLLQQVLLVPLPRKQATALLMHEDSCR